MLRAVLDTETLGFRTSSVILSVGLVVFDDNKVDEFDTLVKSGINLFIDKEVQFSAGRVAERECVEWWERQNPKVRDELLTQAGMFPSHAAETMRQYVEKQGADLRELCWYCKGPHFDIAKLEDLFSQFNVEIPWHYRKPRCIRTFYDAYGYEDNILFARPKGMLSHNSLHDAAFEAYNMQRLVNTVPMWGRVAGEDHNHLL